MVKYILFGYSGVTSNHHNLTTSLLEGVCVCLTLTPLPASKGAVPVKAQVLSFCGGVWCRLLIEASGCWQSGGSLE